MAFYEQLIGRPLTRSPIVVLPGWLSGAAGSAAAAVDALGNAGAMRAAPAMGAVPALTEKELATAVKLQRRWAEHRPELALSAATADLHYALLQAVWGRPYTFRPYTKSPVAAGLAQYSLLRWAEHVWGSERYASVRGALRTAASAATEGRAVSEQVLAALVELEASRGAEAVTHVLGLAYDHLAAEELDYATFAAWIAAMRSAAPGDAAP